MIAGVDGCKGGWLVAMGNGWPCTIRPSLVRCNTFREVITNTAECNVIVVDMPIGLPSGNNRRFCDLKAKELLGPVGGNRVFLTPPRELLQCGTAKEFQDRHMAIFGAGAGLPVWGIISKLKEVDEVLTPELQTRVFEFHPELVWRQVLSKKTAAGVLKRIEMLRPYVQGFDALYEEPATIECSIDDLLDALIGLSVASYIRDNLHDGFEGPFERRLPRENPPVDVRGLRMEIWF